MMNHSFHRFISTFIENSVMFEFSVVLYVPLKMSMADMENKGGRRQHHQGSIQNTNGMSMICALGQGLVIFVIDAGMIDTVRIN